jgi:hypothetical protein
MVTVKKRRTEVSRRGQSLGIAGLHNGGFRASKNLVKREVGLRLLAHRHKAAVMWIALVSGRLELAPRLLKADIEADRQLKLHALTKQRGVEQSADSRRLLPATS